jgi:pyruvate dehydrogenase E2 component (dihydrolipoamide acetyltransferase)
LRVRIAQQYSFVFFESFVVQKLISKSMPTQITLPNLGENIESGDVLSILVREGDVVKADQELLEVETDKATMPIPSPDAGKIVKILVSEGDTVNVGAPIMEIEPAEADGKAEKKKEPPKKQEREEKEPAEADEEQSAPKPAQKRAKQVVADDTEEAAEEPPREKKQPRKMRAEAADVEGEGEEAARQKTPKRPAKKPVSAEVDDSDEDVPGNGHASAAAGPAVRRLARQLGVDLRRVRPTGEAGRITIEDVRAHVRETNEQVAAAAPRGVKPPGAPDTDEYGAIRIEKLSRLRQTIARNMIESYTTIPQLTNFDDADVTELEDMREQSKADYAARGIKLTAMPFLIKALASSLLRHPMLNASVDLEDNQVIYKEYVHIGIAVDTDRGLIVPVMRDVDRKSISQIASELDRLATMVREGDFEVDDLRGGTFTISNLGSVGGIYSTPIINPPQVAILLVGRTRTVPKIVDEAIVPRLMMPLSLTYDHRLVDGAAAARFLNEVKGYLAAPGRLLLAP